MDVSILDHDRGNEVAAKILAEGVVATTPGAAHGQEGEDHPEHPLRGVPDLESGSNLAGEPLQDGPQELLDLFEEEHGPFANFAT